MNVRKFGQEAQEAVVAEMKQEGRVPTVEFAHDAVIAEMIGTDDGAKEFVETVTYSAYSGRENVPLVYRDIYRNVTNANFPKTMSAEEFGPVQIVFLKKWEGGEVKFGAMGPGEEKSVTFETWAAGIEYDEDIVEYNQTWRVGDIGEAFGEAYNKLLNHLHLSPIIDATYVKTGSTIQDQFDAQNAGTAQSVAFHTDIATTLRDAVKVLPKNAILLTNSFDVQRIEEALAGDLYADNSAGPARRRINLSTALQYDGTSVKVGGKVYEYAGVPAGVAYLVVPKANFIEYVKHDLRVDSNDGDLTRLILTQVVGRTRRAVLAGVGGADGAIKIALQ